MEFYKKLAAICCLLVVLNVYGTSATITAFTQIAKTGATIDTALAASGTTNVPNDISLAEDFGTGTITTISVTGSDASGTWASASLTGASGDAAVAIVTVAGTGVVTVAALDFETNPKLLSTLTFTEATVDYTIDLTLTVTNVAPVFLPLTYAQVVTDGSGASTSIATVTATDANTTPTYAITAGDTASVFEVTAAGLVQIATGQTVVASTLTAYALQIEALDAAAGSGLTGTTTVAIGVC